MTSEMSSSSIVPAREGGDLSCWALVWGAATVRLFAESPPAPSLSSAGERDLLTLLYVEVDRVVTILVSENCLSEESLDVSSS